MPEFKLIFLNRFFFPGFHGESGKLNLAERKHTGETKRRASSTSKTIKVVKRTSLQSHSVDSNGKHGKSTSMARNVFISTPVAFMSIYLHSMMPSRVVKRRCEGWENEIDLILFYDAIGRSGSGN